MYMTDGLSYFIENIDETTIQKIKLGEKKCIFLYTPNNCGIILNQA